MFSRTFTYKDYDGNTRQDTWYFNLSKAELMKMELGAYGGLDSVLRRLMREENPKEIINMFEEIILSAVGEKSPDGRRFIKNQSIRDDFRETEAYSDLFYELVTDPSKAALFLRSCIPEELSTKIAEEEAKKAQSEKGSGAAE